MSMKNPMISAGIEPATSRFVAQHLNHCATAVPGMQKFDHIYVGFRDGVVDVDTKDVITRSTCYSWYVRMQTYREPDLDVRDRGGILRKHLWC